MTGHCEWCDAPTDDELDGLLCRDCAAEDVRQLERDERARYLREREDDWAIDAARGK